MEDTLTTGQKSIDFSIARLIKAFENYGWVECPICMEEWTKMRPCLFWEMGKKLQRDVCIHCAETLKNFYFIAKEYPVFGGGVDIKIKWSGPKSIGVKFHVKQMDGSFKDRID